METAAEKQEQKSDLGNALIDSNRVMNFSDAIFAFAATLLVLKIDLPVLDGVDINTALPGALINLWPQYLANIITFFVIGHYWLEHHAIFSKIKRYNSILVWLNIILLISVAFLPFPVDLYGDHYNVPFVVAFYSGALAIVGLLNLIIWVYASSGRRLIDNNMSQEKITHFTIKASISPIGFGLAVPPSFIHPLVAQFSWAFLILGIILVNKLYKFRN